MTGFVEPATGRTVWHVSSGISKELFELVLADFAKSVGSGKEKRVVLQGCPCALDRGSTGVADVDVGAVLQTTFAHFANTGGAAATQ